MTAGGVGVVVHLRNGEQHLGSLAAAPHQFRTRSAAALRQHRSSSQFSAASQASTPTSRPPPYSQSTRPRVCSASAREPIRSPCAMPLTLQV
ncbi:hypothetical protein [Lysobacter gummosus]|uniref:hypothetical protein n=1 Tax=Lysobacter gummosus TaxID=262324 RepID=UPI00363D2C97